MARSIGPQLPASLFARLGPDHERGDRVVLLLTVDSGGFPHTCLLSYYQVVAATRERVLFATFRGSRTARNLQEGRGAAFIFAEVPVCYYVKGRPARVQESAVLVEGAPHTIFQLRTSEVLVDESGTAPLRSPLTFDASQVRADHERMFDELSALATAQAAG